MPLDINIVFKLVPEFDGESDRRNNLSQFLHCCDVTYRMATTAEDKVTFLNVLHAKITGKAYQVLEQNPEADYPALKAAFQAQYDKSETYESLFVNYTECETRRQHHHRVC